MRTVIATIVLAFAATMTPAKVFSQVHVRGYVRSNGTYVQPHFRSTPDGNFWNNWSTKGNINPYTGRPGTRVTPPAHFGAVNAEARPSVRPVEMGVSLPHLRNGGLDALPATQPQFGDNNYDRHLRISKAEDLRRHGVTVDWKQHSWSELIDMYLRVCKAKDLRRHGVTVDWKQHSWNEMIDMYLRVCRGEELRRTGFTAK